VALCGRDGEIRRIVEDCRRDRLVVVIAEPGLGATSLLKAGVAPALRADGFITVVLGDWQGPSFAANLKEAVAEAVRTQIDDRFSAQPETLSEMLYRIIQQTGSRAALLLDRFEEYLGAHSGTDLAEFFDAELADAISRHHGVFAIAIDQLALPSLERFSQMIPNLFGYNVTLSSLSSEAAGEVVARMAEERGLSFEPEVARALTAAPAAAFNGGVHPYFLTCGAARLLDAEIRLNSRVARMSTLDSLGGADRLIMESLDARIGELNKAHSELFFRWCGILISPESRALAVTEKALTECSGKLHRSVPALLPILIEMGLIRTFEISGTPRYELGHRCMAPIVRDWRLRREIATAAREKRKLRIQAMSVGAVSVVVMIYAVWLFMNGKR
jgi:hypothetical protein